MRLPIKVDSLNKMIKFFTTKLFADFWLNYI